MKKFATPYIKLIFIAIILLCFTFYRICQPKPLSEIILSGNVFGVEHYQIKIITNQSETIAYDFQKKTLEPFLISLNQEFSTYVNDSYISTLNHAELNAAMPTSKLFDTAFEESLQVNKLTDGAFDPSVGNLINLWGFGEKKQDLKNVTEDQIKEAKSQTGLDAFDWKKGSIQKKRKVSLNISSVVEGFAVDLVAKLLDEQGYQNYLIDIGGENLSKGTNIDGHSFRIGIEIPKDNNNSEDEKFNCIIELKNAAIATSGNYKQFYIKDGIRYSHIIDPQTGYPAQNNLASATVITKTCMRADTINTAFMVMGLEKSLKFVNEHPEMDAIFIVRKNENEFETVMSNGFSKHLIKKSK